MHKYTAYANTAAAPLRGAPECLDIEQAFHKIVRAVKKQHPNDPVFAVVRRCDAYIGTVFAQANWPAVEAAWLSIAAVAERHDIELDLVCMDRARVRLVLARRQYNDKRLVGFLEGMPCYRTPIGDHVRAFAHSRPRGVASNTYWEGLQGTMDRELDNEHT